PQLIRYDPQHRLEGKARQRDAGENNPRMGFVQVDDVRQPDRQERKTGGHAEEVEKEEQPEDPEVRVVFVGTGCCVHYFYPQRRAGCPARHPYTRSTPIRMAVSGSRIGSAIPACISHSPLTVCGASIHAGSLRMVCPPSPVIWMFG